MASAREKSIRHGHPSTLHLWWARRPLAAARAVIFAQMVDDPSAYVDVLRADPKLRRQGGERAQGPAEAVGGGRDARREGQGTGLAVPEPGPEPTLDDMLADQERQRLFRIIEDLVLWENTTNETVLQAGARRDLAELAARPAPTTPTIRGRRSCSTATSCPPSTTPSPAAARCRWRRSGSGWRATPAT